MKLTDSRKLLIKGAVVVITAMFMLIPMIMVRELIGERELIAGGVRDEIADSWGGRQVIGTPELRVPNRKEKVEEYYVQEYSATTPDRVDAACTVEVEILERSIYEVPVYRSGLEMSGTFTLDRETAEAVRRAGECHVFLQLPERKGLEGGPAIRFCGVDYPFIAADGGIMAVVPVEAVNAGGPLEWSLTLQFKGMESLEFVPAAGAYSLSMESGYGSPSFNGSFLPSERMVGDDGFTASWDINEISMYGTDSRFGVDFMTSASMYQKTARVIKYFFLVVFLVFIGIFLVEAVSGRNVNIIQYVVTGFSLCLFYLLLLAFSEYISFGLAYLLATVLTVVPLGAYFIAILRTKAAWFFPLAVAAIYAFIYLLLNMETGSLLAGTLALFAVLCVIMYFTRNLNRQGSLPETD